ncbi:MAG: hypothetical protein R3232_03130 [Clostridia bacterium]|nr:hypothetical protein [Clostridia bacterium]
MPNEILKVAIPATRNPFVNAQLTPAGVDPVTGEERYWRSALNYIDGCMGILTTESGGYRKYEFNPNKGETLFYGAAYAGNDIMWLSSFLDSITKLNLSTGEAETYPTGLPHSLSASGFVYDYETGKIFWGSYCQDDMKRKGVSFDSKTKEVITVFHDIPLKNNQFRYGFRNLDGTYTIIVCVPEIELLLWDPVCDTVEVILESFEMDPNLRIIDYTISVQRDDGAIYLPARGWFDPLERRFTDDPLPSKEASWFDIDSDYAYGSRTMALGNACLYRWNLATGDVDFLNEIPDAVSHSFRITGNKKIICINLYGFFYRIDARTGAIEASVKFDSDGIGHIDCIHRIDDERLLCTPFITQRFYEINLRTGKSNDLGRATGGRGEVLQVSAMDDKVYMASYTKGQLVEYDPSQPAHFPENPRIVLTPSGKAMRPVAMCKNNDTIFYSCSHEYGYLGSTMVRYTPSEGKSLVVENPIKNHMIRSLFYDSGLDKLIAATTYHADCRSCVPVDGFFILAIIDPITMKPERLLKVCAEQEYFHIFGRLTDGCYLCGASGAHMELDKGFVFFKFSAVDFNIEPYKLPAGLIDRELMKICSTGSPGIYVSVTKESVSVWDFTTGRKIRELVEIPGVYKVFVQNEIVYLVCQREIIIIPINT